MQKSSKHEAQCIKWHKKTVPSRTQSLSYDRGEKEKQKGGRNREGGSGRQRKKAGKKEKPGRGIRKNILTSAVWFVGFLFFFFFTSPPRTVKGPFGRSELCNHQHFTST